MRVSPACSTLASDMTELTSVGENPINIGDLVRWTAAGDTGTVRSLEDGLAVVAFSTGNSLVAIDQLESLPQDPLQDLLEGNIGRAEPYGLRLQALYLKHAYRFDPCAGLSNARIEPELHQVYVAHRVVSKLRPRMILADEVGLGKTIEAGLVIKELRARGLLDRVIIITPASLTLQWQQEMISKFNEDFEVIDRTAIKFLSKNGGNPWTKRDNVICSLEFARRNDNFDSIVAADWDLAVFDEAHRVRRRLIGTRVERTRAYELADELKEHTNGLLLLTATPMQLDKYELYSLIDLVEPGLYTFQQYSNKSNRIPVLNNMLKDILRWDELNLTRKHRIKSSSYLPLDADLEEEKTRLRAEKILLKRHPLAEVMVRNRKAIVGGFSDRNAKTYLVDLSQEEADIYEEVSDYIQRGYNKAQQEGRRAIGFVMVVYQKLLASSSHALRKSLIQRIDKLREQLEKTTIDRNKARPSGKRGRIEEDIELAHEAENPVYWLERYDLAIDPAAIEDEIIELEELVKRLGNTRDAKASELLRIVKGNSNNSKIIIFTQFLNTQEFLRETLEMNGYDVSIFNGQMTLEQKEKSIQIFRSKSQILITTEAGGEGRNFQFSNIMINYDLPWNPMKIEQRIGRLDRIGQKSTVHIYNLACRGTIEERILEVLDKRIGLFEESVGSLDPILGDFEKDIRNLILSSTGDNEKAFDKYSEYIGDKVMKARRVEQLMDNFALDRASFRRDLANKLLTTKRLATPDDLRQYIADCLKYFGGQLIDHDEGGVIVRLSSKLMNRLQTRSSAHRGIFDPRIALEHEELAFFAFGHQLIDSVVDLPINLQPLPWTGTRIIDGLSSGVYLEVFYEFTTQGSPPYGIMVHHLVSEDGTVKEEDLISIPNIGKNPELTDVPTWLPVAAQATRSAIMRRYTIELAEANHRIEEWKEQELNRERRIFDYGKQRLEEMIDNMKKWISAVESNGTKGELRVLPARKGKLKKDQKRLMNLQTNYESIQKEIIDKQHGLSMKILAAGLVTGK